MRLIEKQFKFLAGTLVVTFILVILAVVTFPDRRLHLYFLDVGQGDSILIQTPSNYKILIDGGPNQKVLTQLGEVLPFWDKKIDLIIATNPDKDHIDGLSRVLQVYKVGKVWLSKAPNSTESYQRLINSIKKAKVPFQAPIKGDSIIVSDGVRLKVLWPKTANPQVPTINEGSVVALLQFKEFQTLLTGDAEATTQPYENLQERIEVLKVPHHGSKNGMKDDYLSVLDPEVAVVSVGKNNSYGLPHRAVLDQLASSGAKLYQTSVSGRVEVVSDGKNWYTRTQK